MKKEIISFVFLAFLAVFMVQCVSADMFVSQPSSLYNVGDDFSVNVSVFPNQDVSDFLIVKLACGQENGTDEIEIYRVPLSLNAGQQKVALVSGSFDNFLIGNLDGKCSLKASYGGQQAISQDFEITRGIEIGLETGGVVFDPGSTLGISGRAIKTNGKPSEGFAEIKVHGMDASSFGKVSSGKFNSSFTIPENAAAKSYAVEARVYERDESGKITNEGTAMANIRVRQIIKRMGIAVSSPNIMPGNEMLYSVLLYDQADSDAAGDVNVIITSPTGKTLVKKLAKAGEVNTLEIESNSTPGEWKIEASTGKLTGGTTFNVEELQNASFRLANGTLSVTNTGNVHYRKTIEISIGGVIETKEIDIDVGETKKFMLSAPDGEYIIEVSDGDKKESVGSSFLTGSAIRVDDAEGSGFWSKSLIPLWIMLISLAGVLVFYQYGKVSNRTYLGKTPQFLGPINVGGSATKSEAQGLIKEGKREECLVISLKIKNLQEIEKSKATAAEAVGRALTKARDAKAKIYSDGNYKTMIFSPSMTNEEDSNMRAVRIAKAIESILNEHNNKFAEGINFGIGVHGGEMIVGTAGDGKLNFNSIGNTMPLVKSIAERASRSIGISEHVHKRILGKVKSERVQGENYWRLIKVMNREQYSEFIDRFVNTQKEEARRKR